MPALCISVNDNVYKQLVSYTEEVGMSKSKVAENALINFFNEILEDRADYKLAKKTMREFKASKQKTIPAETLFGELGI